MKKEIFVLCICALLTISPIVQAAEKEITKPYSKEIEKVQSVVTIPAFILLAMMKVESDFDKTAVSKKEPSA